MSAKDFQIISRLGEGSYSSVWKVKRLSDGKEYAMKKVKMNSLTEKERENAVNEVRILASLQSPYIIGYKDSFFDDNSMTLCIVMEFASSGDVYGRIQQHIKNRTYFPEKEIWHCFVQILKGLKLLHDKKILHRDLKCANVFLGAEGAKIGDLNVSKVAKNNLVYTQTGTPYYASPEVWRDQPYDAKSDIWSLGCVIYEMAALKPPFRATDMQGLYKKVQKGTFDRIPSQYSVDLFNVISLCLTTSPTQRPSTDQLLNNPLVIKNSKEINVAPSHESANLELLSTIKVPKNMRALQQQLPKSNYNQVQAKAVDQNDPQARPSTTVDKERPGMGGMGIGMSKSPIERVQSAQSKRPVIGANNNYNQIQPSKSPIVKKDAPIVKSQPQPRETEQQYLLRMQKEYLERAKGYSPASVIKNVDPRVNAPHQNAAPIRAPVQYSNPGIAKPSVGGVPYGYENVVRYDNGIKPQSRDSARANAVVQRERPQSHKQESPLTRNVPAQKLQRPASNYQKNIYEEAKVDPRQAYNDNLNKGRKVEYANSPSSNYQKPPVSNSNINKPDDRDLLQKYNNIYNLKQQYDQIQSYVGKKESPIIGGKVSSTPYGNVGAKGEVYYSSPASGVGNKAQIYQSNNNNKYQANAGSKQGVVRPGWWG